MLYSLHTTFFSYRIQRFFLFLFQVKLIICFQLCKLNNENNEIATPSNSLAQGELEGVV